MSGHLLLQSSVGGCVVLSQNSLLLDNARTKSLWNFITYFTSPLPLGGLGFIILNSCTPHIFVILEHTVTCKQFVSCIQGGIKHCSRKKSVLTNIGGKWQPLPQVNRLTWREMVKEGKRKWKREGEAGGVWHYSITIRAVLDFPTFQNKETNFSQSPSGSQRKNRIIFPDSPGACTLYLPPFQRVLHITLSTVEFYYLSYAFLNTKLNSKKVY